MLGVAYKADIGDMRESPALKLIELLQNAGADVSYHDPHVPEVEEHGLSLRSVALEPGAYDAVVIVTAHSAIDYEQLVADAKLVSTFATPPAETAWRQRQDLEALMPTVGQVGLGYWGKNLVRNFDDLAELTWLCDASDELRAQFAPRHPQARVTADVSELLADPELEAVVIATPVPTHYELAKQALEAGKHVFVEKPPAMKGAEMEELVALAEERELVLMPGHLLLYHPGVRKLKELVETASSATSCASTRTGRTSGSSAATRTRSGRSASTTSL